MKYIKKRIQFNKCSNCCADGGRCGNMFSVKSVLPECINCYDTRRTGLVTIHSFLLRTDEEIQKTVSILDLCNCVKASKG